MHRGWSQSRRCALVSVHEPTVEHVHIAFRSSSFILITHSLHAPAHTPPHACAKTSGPPIAGILLSLVSLIVFREIQPYENKSTNALSSFAQGQLLSTYLLAYALLIELHAAGDAKLVFVGSLLLGGDRACCGASGSPL